MILRTLLTSMLLIGMPACSDDGGTGADHDADATADAERDGPEDLVERDEECDPAANLADMAADGADTAADGADMTADVSVGLDAVCDPSPDDVPSSRAATCVGPSSAQIDNAAVPEGHCTWIWADGLQQPRGIEVAANGDVLVVERGQSRVVALFDDDADGISGAGERFELAAASGLNHGIAIEGGYLYASSSTTVYRWPYTAGDRSALGAPQTVIHSMPSGGHSTRTLVFDDEGRLYVSVGSASNVDSDSRRSRVRRFILPIELGGGLDFGAGEVFADGLRNEVGLAFDGSGRLWGVENGVDNLNRGDLGGDIHNDNPAEELNLFAEPGLFYGYPYCWSEFLLPSGVGEGPGTQWAHPSFIGDGTHDDAWCRNPDNVVPPRLSMQAHAAPLDIHFYDGPSFPAEVVGDAFVTFHGSWNRDVPTGYKLMRVRFDGDTPIEAVPVLEYGGSGDIAADWDHRPVGVRTGADGRLFVTSDRSGVVIAVGYDGG